MTGAAPKKKRPGLFACVGLDILGHPRALAAGEAMLTWFYALLYTRKHHLDGFVSDEAIENLPKPANRPAFAEKLASEKVGLFLREDGGWKVLRYEEWNETKEEITYRREATKQRVSKHRSNTVGNDTVTRYEGVRNTVVPDSDSGSSLCSSGERVQGENRPDEFRGSHARAGSEPPPGPDWRSQAPSSGKLPDGVVAFEKSLWIEAYEGAVDREKGGEPFTFQAKSFPALRAVVEKHCRGDDRKRVDIWIAKDVGDFVRSVLALDVDSKFWSSYGPDGLLRWHNEERPGLRRSRPPEPQDDDLDEIVKPTDAMVEANEAAAGDLVAALGGIGG